MPACEEAGITGAYRINVFAGEMVEDKEDMSKEDAEAADKKLLKATEELCSFTGPLPGKKRSTKYYY